MMVENLRPEAKNGAVVIPGYRLRFYCLVGALFYLGCAWMTAQALSDAFTYGQFDAMTGPRGHRIKEHLVFTDHPWRFGWFLLGDLLSCVGFGSAGSVMTWVVLRGRRAFKRWPEGM
ncbi:hypothetical protein [Pseudomonas viridiflava]|uniref:hypothetical protein n=1 Tax=Pseudomonas viridiflava TaxID=33069 RepID=UPI000F037D9B|nr:hypothetical protein [Pseudomonas viridiflava]